MRSIETCPLQWSLSHASYPAIWDRPGYPGRASVETVAGQVVHKALEEIVRALASGEVDGSHESQTVNAVKALGGYTTMLDRECRVAAAKSLANPRVNTSGRNLLDELRQRMPRMRQELQILVSRVNVPTTDESRNVIGRATHRTQRKTLHIGLNAEVELGDADGHWQGVSDLVVVVNGGVEIVDFKTGVPKDDHSTQVLLYSQLLRNDRQANPHRWPVRKLTIVYPDQDKIIELPSDSQLDKIEAQLAERAMRARRDIEASPPEARPSPEGCAFCSVRQLCPTYWTAAGQALAGAALIQEGLVDAEVRLHERYAPSSWRASVVSCGALKPSTPALVRCSDENELSATRLAGLVHGRILAAQLIKTPEHGDARPSLNLSRASEVFALAE
jgi:CRISPR/Cas system-associated exonuclease Cas4 (RecB family)